MNTHPASLFLQAFPVRVSQNSSNLESEEYGRLVARGVLRHPPSF
jgi:hypothetical protein